MISATLQQAQPDRLEVWLRFAGICVTVIGTGIATWIGTRRTSRKLVEQVGEAADHAQTAATAAGQAARLSEPTGNGWAAQVITRLEQLSRGQEHLDEDLRSLARAQEDQARILYGHVSDHAAAELRKTHQ